MKTVFAIIAGTRESYAGNPDVSYAFNSNNIRILVSKRNAGKVLCKNKDDGYGLVTLVLIL